MLGFTLFPKLKLLIHLILLLMQKEETILTFTVPVEATWSNAAILTARRGKKSIPANVLLHMFLRMTQVYVCKASLNSWMIQTSETQISPSLPRKHYSNSHPGQCWLSAGLYSFAVTDPASEENNVKAAPFTTDGNVQTFFPPDWFWFAEFSRWKYLQMNMAFFTLLSPHSKYHK